MNVNVAGAGAGKTTKMADLITSVDIPDGKMVFCIAFTNAAAENIEKKVISKLGELPSNIKISTIHSFLYQELIKPYYYFLYGKQFGRISMINLSKDNGYKQAKLSELEDEGILHSTKIPEKAKWVAYKKSKDTKAIKDTRVTILKRFSDYCAAIYVDEAQDIDEDVRLVLESLDAVGVEIFLYGDPKQDVKGLRQFRKIIENAIDVNYIPECHRCPQKHLNLSNLLACDFEKQEADNDKTDGSIEVIFESDIDDMESFLAAGNYGLQYISSKRGEFDTHEKQEDKSQFENLHYEVRRNMMEKWRPIKPEMEIERAAFRVAERMLKDYDDGVDPQTIIGSWVGNAFDKLDKKRYVQMAAAFKVKEDQDTDAIIVSSIERIKGLEANRCLFILTTDLAPYLFREKIEDNKTSHLCYVALTRSKDNLTILITKKVEEKYTRNKIKEFFEPYVR